MTEHAHTAADSSQTLYLAVSIIVAALIVSASVFMVGGDLSRQISQVNTTFAALVGSGATTGNGNGAGNTAGNGNETPAPVQADFDDMAQVGPSIGSPDAPVTVVEFSDLSCPFCAIASGANEELLTQWKATRDPNYVAPVAGILKDYIDNGKVRLVFKYFPGHGSGVEAMKVGWCAYDQKAEYFWAFHDKAFANQDQTNNLAKMKELAVESGANLSQLDACLASGKHDARLESETALGRSIGVSGTPTFYINGQSIVGAVPYTQIKAAIDSELAKIP